MKKLLPVIAAILIGGIVFYFINSSTSLPTTTPSTKSAPTSQDAPQPSTDSPSIENAANVNGENGTIDSMVVPMGDEDAGEEQPPAVEAFKTAEDALKAIKNGSVDYDDRVLEQFTEIGEDCSWCDEVYSQVKALMSAPETPTSQRSYYAELLAVSGRVGNVAALIDSIKNAPNQEVSDALSEALELAVGKNDVTAYLGEQLSTASDTLKESLVAAVTNQGTRLAVDVLYKNTVEKGDPDGYYSQGIGLGELVPDEGAMPYLQELALKRDQYSHLAVKSLLNNGLDGLKLVMSSLTNSPNPEFDSKMLKDAVDHVPYDDETKEYLNNLVSTQKDPLVIQFAKEILENSKSDEAEADTAEDAVPDAEDAK